MKKITIISTILLVFTLYVKSQVIYVKTDATGSNNGTSWSDAYTNLQTAVSAATKGDSIWVAAGTYKPTADKTGNTTPTDERTKTFALTDSIFLFGGFAGTETLFSQRDIKNNETILSGDIGSTGDSTDNCYNIIQSSDYDIIDGFTITEGNANGTVNNETDMGGAALNKNVKYVKINNCKITNCSGKQGGSIANYFCGDSISISHCIFLNNIAGNGGAIGNWDNDPTISFCVFENNFADNNIGCCGWGGAIFNWGSGSTTKTINCTFIDNNARTAVIHDRGVHSNVKNSIFFNNKVNDFYYVGSVTYCLTKQSGYAGSNGNIDANPLLYNRGNGVYEISWTSPCIDAGDPAPEYNDDDNSRNNMGAAHTIFSPTTDAFVFSIDTPANESFLYGNYNVSAKITNIGTSSLTNTPINWSIDGTSQPTYNWSGNLSSPDTSETITIGNYNFTAGKHTIKIWTSASGDEYSANDTLTKNVDVFTNLDAGIISLNNPTSHFNNESSTDIYVSVKNFKNDSSIYNVKIDWSVDGSEQTPFTYNDTILPNTVIDSINIGSYSFSRGEHNIKIWTYDPNGLADDDNSNDTLTKTIYSIIYDIGIYDVYKPNNPDTIGTIPIIVSYKNYGFRNVTFTRIFWQINNESPNAFDKSGTVTPGEVTDYFAIGSYNFTAPGTYQLKVWTTAPSGDGDDYLHNDTLTKTITIGNPMCGTYTIGATGDIANFSDAVDSLINKGINGNIIFNVQSDTYNEQVTLPYIQGVSDSNTIVFQSISGDSTDVILTNSGSTVITLKGAKYITFKSMTITADGSNVITANDSIIDVSFKNNIIKSTSSDYTLFNISEDNIIFGNISIINNNFINGSKGICLEDHHNTSKDNFIIKGNVFNNIKGNNISVYRMKNTLISGNTFKATSNVSAIYINERKGINKIEANKIILPQGGTGINYHSYYTSDYTDTIINNSIYVNNGTGINIPYGHNTDSIYISYNSINITGNSGENIYNGGYLKITLFNNILSNTTGSFMIDYYRKGLIISDYNCFYHPFGEISYSRENLDAIHYFDKMESHSIEINPNFQSDSNLMTHNPFLNKVATPIQEITTDIDGNIRDAANPDMGAYEFTPLPGLSGTYEIGQSAPLFKTITDAVDSLISVGIEDAVIFNIENGIYNEQVSIPEIYGTSATQTITFQAASGDRTDVVLSFSASESDKNYTLQLAGVDYVIFKNITIKSENTSYANVINFTGNNYNNTFTGNIITGQAGTGQLIFFKSTGSVYDNTFDNNIFTNGKTGIIINNGNKSYYLHDSANIIVRNNQFVNQTDTSIYLNNCKYSEISGNKISYAGSLNAFYLEKTLYSTIKNNNIHINSGNVIFFINCQNDSSFIIGNKIRIDNGGCGINFHYTSYDNKSMISNNFVLLNTVNSDYGINLPHTKHLRLYNNTIRITGNNNSSACVYTSSNVIIKNNIFSNSAGSYLLSGNFTNNRENNCYFTNGDKSKINYYHSLETDQKNKIDTNSYFLNPYFINDSTYITKNATLNNKGCVLSEISTDIDGNVRDASTPDIGAYEFTPDLTPMHGVYTIGATGTFSTFGSAIDSLIIKGIDNTVTFNIENGTYNEQVIIPEIQGLSENNTITFQSASGDSTDVTLTYSSGNDYNKFVLDFYATNHIIIRNITVKSTTEGFIPVIIEKDASCNTLYGNIITANSTNDNLITKPTDSGSFTDSCNIFKNNYFTNGSTAVNIIDVWPYGKKSIKYTIANNIFSSVKAITSGCDSMEVYGNTINSPYNNTVINCGSGSKIYNNTIHLLDRGTAISADSNSLIAYNTIKVSSMGNAVKASKNSLILNNVLIAHKNNSFAISISDTTGCKIDNNIYFSQQYDNRIINYNNHYFNLNEWQENSNFDKNSIFLNPTFINDSTLYSESPFLNNKGVTVANITTDLTGKARSSTTPDIGAYEFDGFSPLSGEYTIGTDGYFTSFTQITDSLQLCGVKDSVIFIIKDGEYSEHIILKDIEKYPAGAPIIFRSQSGDSTKVTLQYNATDENNNYVVLIDSVNNVMFKNITLKSLSNDFGNVVIMKNTTNNTVFENNIIEATSLKSSLIYADTTYRENIQIKNNVLNNGKYGIVLNSKGMEYGQNPKISGNTLSNQYSYAIYARLQENAEILNNKITHSSPIQDTTWIGIGIVDFKSYNHYSNVANNMISFNATGKSAGIHIFNSVCVNVLFNSVYVYGNAVNSRAFNIEQSSVWSINVYNNIFINKAKGLVYYGASQKCDYNNLFTNGDNFAYTNEFIPTYYEWYHKTSQDVNSWHKDSIFVSPEDLHLKNFTLIGKGISKNEVLTDIDGDKRFTNYASIGADDIPVDTTMVLNGNYTIGESGDFTSFGEVSKVLALCGVNGSVTFNVNSGIYNEPITITKVKNITANDTIAFRSQTGNSNDVLIKTKTIPIKHYDTYSYSFISADNYVVKIANVPNVNIENMTLQALDSSSCRIIVIGDSVSNISISGNKLIGRKNPTYDDNIKSVSIFIAGKYDNPNVSIIGNKILYNSISVYNTYRNGWFEEPDSVNNITIENNTLVDNLLLIYRAKNATFKGNNLHYSNNYGSNFQLIAGNNINIYNNFITANIIYGYNNLISIGNNSSFNNNTVYCSGDFNSYIVKTANNDSIYNNIIINTIGNKTISGGISDYNNIYPNLSELQTTGNNMHSVSFIPNFVSETDLHTNDVLLYHKGVNIASITTDIDGEPRNNPPCIGADEFSNATFDIEDSLMYCYYDKYFSPTENIFNIGYGYDSYQWSNGSDSSSIVIDANSPTGINKYTVTVTVGNDSYTDSVFINHNLPDALPVDTFCIAINDSVEITAAEDMSYIWNTGDTTQSIYATNPYNSYSVTVTDNYGCQNRETAKLERNDYIADINIENDSTITNTQSIEVSAINLSGNIYDMCGFLWNTSDTTKDITFDGSQYGIGTHKLYVNVTNKQTSQGCTTSDTVTVIVINGDGIDNNKLSHIVIYPNPAKDFIVISTDNIKGNFTISILNVKGEKVYQSNIDEFKNNKHIINTSDLSEGIYILQINTNNKVYTNKIIINR